jgi:hypothetical protein
MTIAQDRLRRDLEVLEAMAAEMDDYLRSDVLFWPMSRPDLPRLTVGGYLMRQNRLLALPELLDTAEKARLEAAINQFNEALVEKVVRFEQRAHQEVHARLRQWSEHLRDLKREASNRDYYATTVESRALIEALINRLKMPPYQLEPSVLEELAAYDNNLRKRWKLGAFVWPEGWQPAYPKPAYWWLYGRPR